MEIYVDSVKVGLATTGVSRNDVYNVYPMYNNLNAGFKYSLNTYNFSNGNHSILAKGISKLGIIKTLNTVNVIVNNLTPIGNIETPIASQICSDNLDVLGWFLEPQGIKKVSVILDGVETGTASFGILRADIQSIYPNYNINNGGFKYTLNTYNISNATHSIVIKIESNLGRVTSLAARSFVVKNLTAIGNFEYPKEGSSVPGNAVINGWYLDMSGVDRIEVYVDGTKVGNATYGSVRNDVYNVFPQYNNKNSGFSFNLYPLLLKDGAHTIGVTCFSKLGGTKNLGTRNVTIYNTYPRGNLEKPTAGQTCSGITNIAGWCLDGKVVNRVEVYLDSKLLGNATYGISRPDVFNVYPIYNNTNSGFTYSLDTKKYTNGSHTLKVVEVNNQNESAVIKTISFTILNSLEIVRSEVQNIIGGNIIRGSQNVKIAGYTINASGGYENVILKKMLLSPAIGNTLGNQYLNNIRVVDGIGNIVATVPALNGATLIPLDSLGEAGGGLNIAGPTELSILADFANNAPLGSTYAIRLGDGNDLTTDMEYISKLTGLVSIQQKLNVTSGINNLDGKFVVVPTKVILTKIALANTNPNLAVATEIGRFTLKNEGMVAASIKSIMLQDILSQKGLTARNIQTAKISVVSLSDGTALIPSTIFSLAQNKLNLNSSNLTLHPGETKDLVITLTDISGLMAGDTINLKVLATGSTYDTMDGLAVGFNVDNDVVLDTVHF